MILLIDQTKCPYRPWLKVTGAGLNELEPVLSGAIDNSQLHFLSDVISPSYRSGNPRGISLKRFP
jgi:hypothetical protein